MPPIYLVKLESSSCVGTELVIQVLWCCGLSVTHRTDGVGGGVLNTLEHAGTLTNCTLKKLDLLNLCALLTLKLRIYL